MIYKLSLPIKITLIICVLSLLSIAVTRAVDGNKGFKDRLLDFIKSNERKAEERAVIIKNGDENYPVSEEEEAGLAYNQGDWEKYVIQPKYEIDSGDSNGRTAVVREKEKIDFNSYGSIIFDMT